MPKIDGAALNALTSMPWALTLAGVLAALVVVAIVTAWRRAGARLLLPSVFLMLMALAATALINQFSLAQRAAERRALIARAGALARSALVPGSPLACLDADAGQTVEAACEQAVFAAPQTVAAAVAYTGAQLQLLKDAAVFSGDKAVAAALSPIRRALALDRYGLAAHVLAHRDGCTEARCAAFALFGDAGKLKANLAAQAFHHYVARYAAAWKTEAAKVVRQPAASPSAEQPVAQAPAPAPHVNVEPATADKPIKPGEHWDFPSAASIPPVNIMTAAPPPTTAAPKPRSKTDSKAAPKAAPKADPKKKRKQAQPLPNEHARAGTAVGVPLPLHRPQ